jgi:hypothetical protein
MLATLCLALLGQDVVIFIFNNMAAVVRAGRFSNLPTTPSPARCALAKKTLGGKFYLMDLMLNQYKYFNFFSRSFSKFKMRFYFVIWFHRPSVRAFGEKSIN